MRGKLDQESGTLFCSMGACPKGFSTPFSCNFMSSFNLHNVVPSVLGSFMLLFCLGVLMLRFCLGAPKLLVLFFIMRELILHFGHITSRG